MIIIGNAIGRKSGKSWDSAASTPSALTLVVVNDTTINGSFTINGTGQDGHNIYISDNGGVTYTLLVALVGADNTFSATGLTAGTLYYFYVTAYKGAQESPASNIVDTYFKITIDTTKAGSANDTFILPLPSAGTYDYYVDWGEGAPESHYVVNTSQTHVYAASGTYQIKIRGTFPHIKFNYGGDRLKLISIDNWGNIAWGSFERSFYGCANMNGTYTDTPNLSAVTSMSVMLADCDKFNWYITGWSAPEVLNMSYFLSGCHAFNKPVSISTPKVTNVSHFLEYGDVFNQSVTINTGEATDMSYFYFRCLVYNQPLAFVGGTAKVTNMSYMLEYCQLFNQSLASLNTGKVTTMQRMMFACFVFNQSLASFDVTSLTGAAEMLRYCTLSKVNYDAILTSWAAQAVKDSVTFHGGYSYTTVGGTGNIGRTHLTGTHSWSITDNGNTFDNGKILIVNDDANVGIYNNAYPVMVDESLVGTVYVVTDLVGTAGYMTWANLQTMQAAGHDIQCHSKTHTNETTLTETQLKNELDAVTSAFTTNSLPAPVHHAYPFGAYSANVKTWVATKRSTGRTTLASANYFKMTTGGDKFEIPCHTCDGYTNAAIKALIDETLVDNTGQVLLFHNVGVTGYKSTADFTEIVQYAKAQGVDIITMSQLFALLD